MMKFKKLIILCKGNSVTGGSELIHQLCHELDSLNLRSYICYYPFHINYETPNEYSIYKVEQCALEDSPDILLFFRRYQLSMHGILRNQRLVYGGYQ